MPAFPPAPWRLTGDLTLIPALVRVADARRFRVPGTLLHAAGYTLGGAMLVNYRGGTLVYNELIVFSALATAGGRPGFVVSHIYVDSEASMHGGREIWGLPKELAQFAPGEVRQDGRLLLHATLRRGPGRIPLPLPAPTVGMLAGQAVRALGVARVRAAPALATLTIPAESPFAPLRLGGTRPAIAGAELDLQMPPPR